MSGSLRTGSWNTKLLNLVVPPTAPVPLAPAALSLRVPRGGM